MMAVQYLILIPCYRLQKHYFMRTLFTLSIFLLLAFCVKAQITIERGDYLLEVNKPVDGWRVDTDGLSIPEVGADMVWDYSGIEYVNPTQYVKLPADNSNFPDADLLEQSDQLALNDLITVPTEFYEVLTDDDYYTIGRIVGEAKLPLQVLTGGANDTLFYLETVMPYQEPAYYYRFPINYGDSWGYDISVQPNFEVTVAAFGLNRTPAGQIITSVSRDSVVGYGTLILPHPDGTGTVSAEVLLMREELTQTFEYLLAGQPAPQAMLDLLGVTQGSETKRISYTFMAKGLSSRVFGIFLSEDSIIERAGVADDIRFFEETSNTFERTQLVETLLFPNPSQGTFHVQFDKPDNQEWTFDVINSLGQIIHSQKISGYDGEVNTLIRMNSFSYGLHHYVLRNEAGVLMSSGNILLF